MEIYCEYLFLGPGYILRVVFTGPALLGTV